MVACTKLQSKSKKNIYFQPKSQVTRRRRQTERGFRCGMYYETLPRISLTRSSFNLRVDQTLSLKTQPSVLLYDPKNAPEPSKQKALGLRRERVGLARTPPASTPVGATTPPPPTPSDFNASVWRPVGATTSPPRCQCVGLAPPRLAVTLRRAFVRALPARARCMPSSLIWGQAVVSELSHRSKPSTGPLPCVSLTVCTRF